MNLFSLAGAGCFLEMMPLFEGSGLENEKDHFSPILFDAKDLGEKIPRVNDYDHPRPALPHEEHAEPLKHRFMTFHDTIWRKGYKKAHLVA